MATTFFCAASSFSCASRFAFASDVFASDVFDVFIGSGFASVFDVFASAALIFDDFIGSVFASVDSVFASANSSFASSLAFSNSTNFSFAFLNSSSTCRYSGVIPCTSFIIKGLTSVNKLVVAVNLAASRFLAIISFLISIISAVPVVSQSLYIFLYSA